MWEGICIDTFKQIKIPYGPYKKGYDLFNDGSLYMVHTPGHSDGMFSVLVKMDHGWVLLASDVGYAEKSWNEMVLPGLTVHKKAASLSLEWVREFSKRNDCIRVIANHDPEVKPSIIN